MKKLILIAIATMISCSSVYATTKCTNTPGGFCCWSIEEEGPYPPVTCG